MQSCRYLPVEPEVSICRVEICLHAELQVPACRARSVYLQTQTQSSCIARKSLRAEPKDALMAMPDVHILSHTNLDIERDLKD